MRRFYIGFAAIALVFCSSTRIGFAANESDTCRVVHVPSTTHPGLITDLVDLGVCDTVRIGCPVVRLSAVTGDSVKIPLYVWHDEVLGGFSLGFSYSSDVIEFISLDTTGSILSSECRNYLYLNLHPGSRQILVGWSDFSATFLQPTVGSQGDLLITLNARIQPGFNPSVINLDTAFVPPAGYCLPSAKSGHRGCLS